MAKGNEEAKDTDQEAKPKKSKLKLIILAVVVIILGTGGFFGWDWYSKGKAKAAATGQKEGEVGSIVYPLKSFIVNLFDKKSAGNRYLKVAIELEIDGEKKKAIVDQNIPQLRDTILLLLSRRSLKDVNTLEGKLELKQTLLSRMNRVLGEGIVQRIYFTEFVVQ